MAPDLVKRHSRVDGSDRLWVADITYVPTSEGFLYRAIVLDPWSRRVVGWSMANHLRMELVLHALDMALVRSLPRNLIHHSDQGGQLSGVWKRSMPSAIRPVAGENSGRSRHLHRDFVRVRGHVVRRDEQRRLDGADEIARRGEHEINVVGVHAGVEVMDHSAHRDIGA